MKSGILVEDSAPGEEIKSGGIGEDELGWVQGGGPFFFCGRSRRNYVMGSASCVPFLSTNLKE